MTNSYKRVITCLRGLKGLTEKEAEAYFKICEKNHVSVKEITDIFVDIKAAVSRSKAYTIVDKFKKEGLIFQMNSSSKKQEFKAIHPNALLDELKNDLKNLEPEIIKLVEAYDISDFEIKDPRDISKTLTSESEIVSVCNAFKPKGKLLIVQNKDPVIKKFFSDRLAECGKIIEGETNVILFDCKEEKNKGIIQISKRAVDGGKFRVFGQMLVCDEKHRYFLNKEVK